jgi:esterase/lipase superfamily enzyme
MEPRRRASEALPGHFGSAVSAGKVPGFLFGERLPHASGTTYRYAHKTRVATLALLIHVVLGGLPDAMRIEVDPDIGVSARTVGELRKMTEWSENLTITTRTQAIPTVWFEKEVRAKPALFVDAAAQAALLALTKGKPGIYNVAEDDGAVSIEKVRRELGFDPSFRIKEFLLCPPKIIRVRPRHWTKRGGACRVPFSRRDHASENSHERLRRPVFMKAHVMLSSRRAFLRGFASSGGALALGGCADLAARGARFHASALSINPTLLVVTTRKPVNGGRAKPWFGPERASAMSIARAKLVPPDDGRFSLASVGLADWRIGGIEPVSGQLLEQASGGPDVLIYVHGFRQTFETAALDAARLSDGIRFRGETMVFSWPSKAGLFDYAYDRESAMWSRDAFERVLNSLVANSTIGRVHIVAHSMGTMLALESLRQLYARYGDTAADRIGAVVFASPDIDVDVFSSSITRIGPLAQKITVVTATNDRALALAGRIAGGITRVGAAEKATLERLGLRVIDASQHGWGIINHDLFLSNARVRQVIRRSIDDSSGISG